MSLDSATITDGFWIQIKSPSIHLAQLWNGIKQNNEKSFVKSIFYSSNIFTLPKTISELVHKQSIAKHRQTSLSSM